MLFLFAILATLSYALNNTLMTAYYRKIDLLLAVTLRGIGMGLTMAPLLFLAGADGIRQTVIYIPMILFISVCALFGNIFMANAFKFLPIGIASAICMSLSAVTTAILSWQVMGEKLTGREMIWFSFIMLGVFGIGISKIDRNTKTVYNVPKGLIASVCFSILCGISYTVTSYLAKIANPLVVGYIWEATIGVLGVLFLLARYIGNRKPPEGITKKDFGIIMLYSIPGSAGTACYSMAVTFGPVAFVTAILGTMMVSNAIFAWLIYREKLNRVQWVLIFYVAFMIAGLKFTEPAKEATEKNSTEKK